MSNSHRILAGLALGIATGLFLGERAAWLQPLADGYVKLLQMTVLPVITVSIVSGLGGLTYAQARALAQCAGGVMALLWLLALSMVFLFPLMLRPMTTASFFSTTLVEPPTRFDLVELYIPANPFYSLANNIVPAVVLFSLVTAIALIGTPGKARLLEVLMVVRDTLARAATYVVRLTPIGLFAIAGYATGTLSIDELARIQVYLVGYVALALLVSLWILPGLIAVLTPVSHRRVLSQMHDARSVHRLTAADRADQGARTRARPGRGARERAGRDRPGVVQLPAHRQTPDAHLHLLRRLVHRRDAAALAVPAARRVRAPRLLRQHQRGGAVPARSLPHPVRCVSAVPGHQRRQCPVRYVDGGDAHRGDGHPRHLGDGRCAPDRRAPAAAIRGHHAAPDHRHGRRRARAGRADDWQGVRGQPDSRPDAPRWHRAGPDADSSRCSSSGRTGQRCRRPRRHARARSAARRLPA